METIVNKDSDGKWAVIPGNKKTIGPANLTKIFLNDSSHNDTNCDKMLDSNPLPLPGRLPSTSIIAKPSFNKTEESEERNQEHTNKFK